MNGFVFIMENEGKELHLKMEHLLAIIIFFMTFIMHERKKCTKDESNMSFNVKKLQFLME